MVKYPDYWVLVDYSKPQTTNYLTRQQFSQAVVDSWLSPNEVYNQAKAQWYKIEGEEEAIKKFQVVNTEQTKQQYRQKELEKSWLFKNIVWGTLESAKWVPKIAFKYLWTPLVKFVSEQLGKSEEEVEAIVNSYKEQVLNETFGDEESLAFQGAKLVGDIAQTAAGVWAVKWAFQGTNLAQGLSSLSQAGTKWKAVVWALEWAADVAAFTAVADQRLATWKELALWATIAWSIPLVGAWLKKVAPKLQLSGLLNPKKLDDIKNSLIIEGVDWASKAKADDVANWMFQRGIKWNKQEIIQQLDDIVKQSKTAKNSLLAKSITTHKPKEAGQMIDLVVKELDWLEWFDELLTKANNLKWQKSWTLTQLDEIKSLGDEVFSIFKSWPLGTTKDSLKSKWLANLRKSLKKFIEKQAVKQKLAEGFSDDAVKLLNNQTAIAFNLKTAIARKESSDAAREIIQFLGGRAPWAIVWGSIWATVWPFDSNTITGKIWNVLVWVFAWWALASTSLKTKLANSLAKIPESQKSEIYEWMLSKWTKEISEESMKALDEVSAFIK